MKSGILRKCIIASTLAGATCHAGAVFAATDEEDAPVSRVSAVTLQDLVVRGDMQRDSLDTSSATVLDHKQIADRVYTTPVDILKQSPGISVIQFNQGGTAAAFQLRGFEGASHGPDAAIYVDGVPLNETDGYADTNIVIPDEIERVEIIKGPVSALYGNYASAGVVHFHTFKKGDFTRLRYRYGSFNTQDAVAVIARKDGDLDHVYAIQSYHTDGYQDNSEWDKQNAAARWTWRFNDALDGTLGVRSFYSNWDAPGYIPQDVYDSDRRAAVSDVNGGRQQRKELRLDLRYQINPNAKVLFYTWTYQQEFTRYFQQWISPAQTPGANYGNERLHDRDMLGAGVSYNYSGDLLGRNTNWVVGLDWMDEQEHRQRWNLVVDNGRTRGSQFQDYDIRLYTTSLFTEINHQISDPLRVVLGARYDGFSGTLDERIPSGTFDASDPEIFSPKAGLVWSVSPAWDVFTNYGRGFALPRDQDLWKRPELDPSTRTQYELGTRGNPWAGATTTLVLWRLDTSDDFQPTLDDPNILENAGETRRQGIELSLDAYLRDNYRIYADYALLDTEYLDFVQGGQRFDGNALPSTPRHVANLEISYEPPSGFGGRVGVRYQGDWYINAANTLEADGFVTANTQLYYRFDQRYRLILDVENLFDRKYSEYVAFTNGVKTYAPAASRSAYLSLVAEL